MQPKWTNEEKMDRDWLIDDSLFRTKSCLNACLSVLMSLCFFYALFRWKLNSCLYPATFRPICIRSACVLETSLKNISFRNLSALSFIKTWKLKTLLLHHFLLPSVLVVSTWWKSAVHDTRLAARKTKSIIIYLLLLLQQRGSLMSEWVIPFEELEIAWSPLGSGRFGKVYRQVHYVLEQKLFWLLY